MGREVDLTVATTRLIAGGILDRFPKLKLVIAHFGGGIAAVKDRLLAKGYGDGLVKVIAPCLGLLLFNRLRDARFHISGLVAASGLDF